MAVEAIIADKNLDEAMKEVKKGTIPGKSGFPAEFHANEDVRDIQKPHLQNLYRDIVKKGKMSDEEREASVSVLYKGKGKDPQDRKKYRPVSITGLSYRILTDTCHPEEARERGTRSNREDTSGIRRKE